jgi:hypothetical protein
MYMPTGASHPVPNVGRNRPPFINYLDKSAYLQAAYYHLASVLALRALSRSPRVWRFGSRVARWQSYLRKNNELISEVSHYMVFGTVVWQNHLCKNIGVLSSSTVSPPPC